MSSSGRTNRLTRRQLLKIAGAAVAATAPSLAAPALAAPTDLSLAVLLPNSRRYPALGREFAAGVRRGLTDARRPARLLETPLSTGQTNASAELAKLLAFGKRTIGVGVIGAERAAELHAALAEVGGLFIAADLGANIPRYGEASPRVLNVTLGAWQASYALGAWAARAGSRRAAAAISFYESGYDLPYAFRLGYEAAGGAIVGTEITHLPGHGSTDLGAALARLAEGGPDLLFAAYSGDEAAAFARAYGASPLAGRVPLVGPGFLADEALLAREGRALVGARTALAWGDAPLRPRLVRSAPGPFELLGYEAALLALRAEAFVSDDNHLGALETALPDLVLASPRGELRLDPASRGAHGSVVLREVRAAGAGARSVPIATLPGIGLDDPGLAEMRASLRTGWLHAYLAV